MNAHAAQGSLERTPARPLLGTLVFASGAAALLYQVLWTRQLGTFLGASGLAQAIVVATYMAGLALGARVGGTLADRTGPSLRLVALLEAGIALYGLAAVVVVPRLPAAWARIATTAGLGDGPAASALRTVAAVAVLAVPTCLMGATLPVLIKTVTRSVDHIGARTAWLYSTNTLGAAAGALVAGYVTMPLVGLRNTGLVAAAVNGLVALAFLVIARRSGAASQPAPEVEGRPLAHPPEREPILVLLALAGLLALVAELAWIRGLTLIIGSSVYAFSLTLATYLLGIAVGSAAYARWLSHDATRAPTVLTAAWLSAGIGTSVALGTIALRHLPEWFVAAWPFGLQRQFVSLQLLWFALAAVVILLPTALSGALLPAAVAALARDLRRLGRDSGAAWAANTAGAVLGAVLAATVLLPGLGAGGSLLLVVVGHSAVAAGFWWLRDRTMPSPRTAQIAWLGLVVIALATSALFGRWDRKLMTSGPYVNAFRLADRPTNRSLREFVHSRDELLFYAEDADAVVTVRDNGPERILSINGKPDGTRLGDRRTQATVAHLPMLAHQDPRRVLVIGLGTGISAGTVLLYPEVERLQVVEISKAVVAASTFFQAENGAVLLDPRSSLQIGDARSFLLATRERFDVIVSEPSNPWISGVANLFTREFFELADSRLAPGGILAQWFHVYGIGTGELRSLLATVLAVFPELTVWVPQTGDLVLLASHSRKALDLRRFERLAADPEAATHLAPAELYGSDDIARMFLMGTAEATRFAAAAPLNVDDHPRLEFEAPRSLYQETTMPNLVAVIGSLGDRTLHAPIAVPLVRSGDVVETLGLRLRVPDGVTLAVDWRVRWTVLEAAGDPLGVRVAVSQAPTIVASAGSHAARVEIVRAPPEVAADEDLSAYLSHRAPVPIDGARTVELADETRALWAAGALEGGATFELLAFDCPAGHRFLASAISAPGQVVSLATKDTLLLWATRLDCAAPRD